MKKNKKHYDKYKKFDVVYADFGRNPHGVQGGIRPGIVVSCDASNHGGAPQISVVPLWLVSCTTKKVLTLFRQTLSFQQWNLTL